ncbi:MAG: arginase family protein, partial [Chitinophagales bacterium]
MTKEEIIQSFNPNDPGNVEAGIYSLPFTTEQSDIVLIPVPWEATVSYGNGAWNGPEAILQASLQMDLCHYDYPDLWKRGIAMDEVNEPLKTLGKTIKGKAAKIIETLECGKDPQKDEELKSYYNEVNTACEKMNQWVEERTQFWLGKGKIVGLVGGDHSSPLGYLRTLSKQHKSFGILTVDAHMDFRKAYEGFTYSHASI